MTPDPSTLSIVHYPAAVLRQRAKPIDVIDDDVRAVARRMFELMKGEDGLGLAAPQVGVSWRMFVTRDDPLSATGEPRAYINPTLKVQDPSAEIHEEGCLSLPGIHVDIHRPRSITITAKDLDDREFSVSSDQFIARVWQHEMDHLNGVLIIDKMSPLDRLAKRKQIKELESAAKKISAVGGLRVGLGVGR